MTGRVVILGVFVADTAFHAPRQPRMGETLLGSRFVLGPGGKGSNQSVAVARLGAEVSFITRLGRDAFGEIATRLWDEAGVTPALTIDESGTGAAYIFLEEGSGENAIIICPGAAAKISIEDIEARAGLIRGASVFMTQLEQPLAAAERGLAIAREAGVITVLNPAPAQPLAPRILALCDYLTPNETEAEALATRPVRSIEDAEAAGRVFLEEGAGAAVITLGDKGALLVAPEGAELVPALRAGAVCDTTGAGDAFNGGFATGLARGMAPIEAVRFGCAVAAISVTREGTAPSMPRLAEVEALLARER